MNTACKTPGQKIKSKGKGLGLGTGKGHGPINFLRRDKRLRGPRARPQRGKNDKLRGISEGNGKNAEFYDYGVQLAMEALSAMASR